MTDSIFTRETEFINYLRNNLTDPLSRGTSKTDTFTATAGQTVFTLTQTLVKNIVSVTVNATPIYIGYNYSVSFGEGTSSTTVTLNTASTVGDTVIIIYKYGTSMVNSGFQRLDSELPRIAVIPMSRNTEFLSIGETGSDTGKWSYKNCTYNIVVRSRFAKQYKDMMDDVENKINAYRQLTPQPYRTIITIHNGTTPEDFDNDLRLYQGIVSVTIKWLMKFKD